MNLVIIQYNAGNIQSVLYALERLGITAMVTDEVEKIQSADRVIFPGVGEASSAMEYLTWRNLDKVITGLQQPVLGICLGMQLLCAYSEENETTCLGVFNQTVKKMQPTAATDGVRYKIPQIGWNNIEQLSSPLFQGVAENSYCYFVHGYYVPLDAHTIATANYIQPYSAALHKDNFYGVQFHPEKSAETGATILRNFLAC